MPEVFVDKISDFADGDRRILFHDGSEIGVFHWQGHFYAYQSLSASGRPLLRRCYYA